MNDIKGTNKNKLDLLKIYGIDPGFDGRSIVVVRQADQIL